MAFRIHPHRPIDREVRRIALEQIDAARSEALDPDLGWDERIHEVRKRCKRLRGLLHLVREALGNHHRRENAFYRSAAASLSGARDARVMVATFDEVIRDSDEVADTARFDPLRGRLEFQQESSGADGPAGLLEDFARRLDEGRARVPRWSRKVTSLEPVLEGFARNYRLGRRMMREVTVKASADAFHDWRKHTKRLAYHLELLEGFWRPVLRAHRREAKRLGDLLGTEHDLSVLESFVRGRRSEDLDPKMLRGLGSELGKRRRRLQRRAVRLGARVYVEKPREILSRLDRLARVK